jgi:hypothetical protein
MKKVIKFENGWSGIDSIYQGLKDILDGKQETVTFIIADHPIKHTQEKVHKTYTIGRCLIDDVLCWRWCGERGLPDSAGSHAVCASWNEQDLALAVGVVAYTLARDCQEFDAWIFRQ